MFDLSSYLSAFAVLLAMGAATWVVSLINKCAGAALLYAGFRMAGVTVMR